MNLHSINETYRDKRRGRLAHWRHFLNLDEKGKCVSFEWCVHITGFGLSIQTDDCGDHDLLISTHLGFISTYLGFDRFHRFKKRAEWSITTHDHMLWVNMGLDPDSWSRDEPRWRRWSFDPVDFLFGSPKCNRQLVDDPINVVIPLPEGMCPAVLQKEIYTWKRPRWPFSKVRKSIDIDIPNGLKVPGKGENSWDMDDDAIFGMGSEGHDVAHAIGKAVEAAMRDRLKYGYSVFMS